MTREQFNKLSFEEVLDALLSDTLYSEIISMDVLKEYAKHCVNTEKFVIAHHVLASIIDYEDAPYFFYDISLGTLTCPDPLRNKEELEPFIYFEDEE
jgi:hypothetical protein